LCILFARNRFVIQHVCTYHSQGAVLYNRGINSLKIENVNKCMHFLKQICIN